MKRYGNLYPQIIAFDNLLATAKQAQRSKRYRNPVLAFNANLETELFQLQQELQAKTYVPGEYKLFEIYEPKQRQISAAPYRDRVVHHALCNIIVPIFHRTFITTTFANRKGYGSHRALTIYTHYARSSRYVLQCDIQKYFPSIDIAILQQQLRRKLKCRDTLWLIDTILNNPSTARVHNTYFPSDHPFTPYLRPKGLPIGNLTSQFFANVYLSSFDRFVKQTLKASKYLRYVDDFALFADDREYLADCRVAIEEYLATLRLKIHPIKSQLFHTRYGGNFVGFRVFGDRIRVRNYNLQTGRRRLKQLQDELAMGQCSVEDAANSLRSWNAHLAHGDTWRLRQNLFASVSPAINPIEP